MGPSSWAFLVDLLEWCLAGGALGYLGGAILGGRGKMGR
jgi:hypothetical protein